MSYKFIIKTNASIEIENVIAYYSAFNILLAQKIELEIRIGFQYIAKYPVSFQCRYDKIRIFWIDKFPYGIYFVFDKGEVFILAFWHEKEDIPNKLFQIL